VTDPGHSAARVRRDAAVDEFDRALRADPSMSVPDQLALMQTLFVGVLEPDLAREVSAAFDEMCRVGTGRDALSVGDRFPDFELPAADATIVRLDDYVARGPVVISFYRGGWCPYCNLELRALSRALPRIRRAGADLLAISPEPPDVTMGTVAGRELGFAVLSDTANQLGREIGIVVTYPPALQRHLAVDLGLDLSVHNRDGTHDLPAPATFVVDEDRTVRLAWVDVNYRRRLDPEQIIAYLTQLAAR
jgi:peroxiredoxin